jgi:hypothetical protein
MKNFIICACISFGITFATQQLAEKHYQNAIQYTTNVAETDGDIVWAMEQWGFEISDPFEDITERDKMTALFNDKVN